MKLNLKISVIFLMTMLAVPLVEASDQDLHKLWDDRCASCHGHSGEFSRTFLSVSNAELQGKHHVNDLRLFLSNHYLAGRDVNPIYNMLLAQASNKTRFKNECSTCHESAAKLVRDSLILRDGVLHSRESKSPVRDFLNQHRELQPKDVDFFMQQLTRVAHEIYRP